MAVNENVHSLYTSEKEKGSKEESMRHMLQALSFNLVNAVLLSPLSKPVIFSLKPWQQKCQILMIPILKGQVNNCTNKCYTCSMIILDAKIIIESLTIYNKANIV